MDTGQSSSMPTHFVVELDSQGSRRYAICERMLVVDSSDASSGLSPESIEDLLKRNPLRAAVLPTSGGPGGGMTWSEHAATPQSGRNIYINIGGNDSQNTG